MDVIVWNENFETGLDEVDQQHRHLVEITNRFGRILFDKNALCKEMEEIFAELVSYTQYHFSEEENLMETIGIDERHVDYHKNEHASFLQSVLHLYGESKLGRDTGKPLFEFLMNWLVYHILGSDRSFGEQCTLIEQGNSPQQAYEHCEHQADGAKGVLLEALNRLFHQVLNRNHELRDLNQTLERRVDERTQELVEANQQLGELAMTDFLTGLHNRRHALLSLEALWDEAQPEGLDLACIIIDTDGFKEINDTYGHDVGDQVLCLLARQLKEMVRTDDIVCRMGGDEFLIICPKTDIVGAMHVGELLHQAINELQYPLGNDLRQASTSIGVAAMMDNVQTLEALLVAADKGVYEAKKAGKNCVKSLQA
ncbi:GGDEF domain-containing protein [Desulfuromonas acetoxidans]|uniref:GGDEF domain-containing protein n=1 Tax=Desulfuromonas acetoxidans TaxID=891 RepID=UPI002930D722|nr:GGDEF domain-containing protein [Desulfuromonas acetoxidans]